MSEMKSYMEDKVRRERDNEESSQGEDAEVDDGKMESDADDSNSSEEGQKIGDKLFGDMNDDFLNEQQGDDASEFVPLIQELKYTILKL